MRRAYLLLTDSGSIQEEALLVLREKTERPEAVEAEYQRRQRIHNPTVTAG
jgi:UDP-N-acetylglucosamine 2-epimerase